jgi:hypothetical protein
MRQSECLMVVLVSVFLCGCQAAKSAGSGTALRVNFTDAAKSPDARIKPANRVVFDIGRLPELPSKPTTGTRKQAPAAAPATAETLPIRPCLIAVFPCAFDGVAQDNCGSCTAPPPDPNAAAGAGKIVEVVNDLIQVTNRMGAVECGGPGTLNTLLRTTNSLSDPRVQFDNVNQRFSFSVTVSNPAATDTPAMFVAATETEDPCGNWFVYRLTFHGSAYPTGSFLDFPMLGQDTNALLLSLRTCLRGKNCLDPDGAIFSVFGLPKSIIYSNQHVEFNSFQVDSLTAPVTNAGQPMIASPVSFFLAAVPGTGYKLYRLTNSGGPGATLTKTTIAAPFSKPSRRVNQPGTIDTLDPSDGNITSFPYFDGALIWFSHDGDDDGFPTVRYGAVDTRNNTVATTWAFHSGSSDDFNSSVAVGITPRGETVFINWAFTDTPAGKATTDVFGAGDASKPLVTIAGPGTIYASGGVSSQGRFGDFSSVSLDPSVSGCAFATQQYFATDGNWKTRIQPIGQCESIVVK